MVPLSHTCINPESLLFTYSLINVAPLITDPHDDNSQGTILNRTDHTIITGAVAPELTEQPDQCLANAARGFERSSRLSM